MDTHRCARPKTLDFKRFDAPFSSFEWVESRFAGNPAVHRCFSLARSFSAKTLISEVIPATGLIAEENDELRGLGFQHTPDKLLRLSFWNRVVTGDKAIGRLRNEDLIGFTLLKRDVVSGHVFRYDGWHVFEAVFQKYAHPHNCVPGLMEYKVRIGQGLFRIPGVLYCQQNGLNKACAHVALRSLLSRLGTGGDASYGEMNRVARKHAKNAFRPGDGLSVRQMRAILDHYGTAYHDVDYVEAEKNDPDARKNQPYQKYLYAGIESGCGGFLGFSMAGPKATEARHIIPFYGHTFNKDTWVPDAQVAYFDIGGDVGYIPSESWTSSFIGHDDNFGPNFCIPRLYVRPAQMQYVVEILKPGVAYNGVIAEVQALQFLYSLYDHMDAANPWQVRLAKYAHPKIQRVVMRAVCVDRERYLEHLRNVQDWDGKREDSQILNDIGALLPKMLWVVEVSIPHLFPANERKLGEIVLDACRRRNSKLDIDFGLFALARLPGQFVLMKGLHGGTPSFQTAPSGLRSHVELLR